MIRITFWRWVFCALMLLNGFSLPAAPMGSAFSYQGLLTTSNQPATGVYDFTFGLFDVASGGVALASVPINAVSVQNGLFKVDLDFGAAPFMGNARWIEIAVRPTSLGGFTTLTPRQELKPTPNSIWANQSQFALISGKLTEYSTLGQLGVVSQTETGNPSLAVNYPNGNAGVLTYTIAGDRAGSVYYSPAGLPVAACGAVTEGGLIGVEYSNANPGVTIDTSTNKAAAIVYNLAGQTVIYLGVNALNGGNLTLTNSLGQTTILLDGSTGTKSFIAPLPSDASKQIVYACPEGPEAAIYCRGTVQLVNGAATVALPDHFSAMCSPNGITVQLTPKSADSLGCAVVENSPKQIRIRELAHGTGNYGVDWQVTGIRLGLEDFKPVRSKAEMQSLTAGSSGKNSERVRSTLAAIAKQEASHAPAK